MTKLFARRKRTIAIAVYQHKRDPNLSAFVVIQEEHASGRINRKQRVFADAYMKKLRFKHARDVIHHGEMKKPKLYLVPTAFHA